MTIGLPCITLLLHVMVKLKLVMKQPVFLLVMPILLDYSMLQKPMVPIPCLKILILVGIPLHKFQILPASQMLLPISHNLLINVNKVPNFFTTPLLLFKMELLTETLILTTFLLKSVLPMITEVNNVSWCLLVMNLATLATETFAQDKEVTQILLLPSTLLGGLMNRSISVKTGLSIWEPMSGIKVLLISMDRKLPDSLSILWLKTLLFLLQSTPD